MEKRVSDNDQEVVDKFRIPTVLCESWKSERDHGKEFFFKFCNDRLGIEPGTPSKAPSCLAQPLSALTN